MTTKSSTRPMPPHPKAFLPNRESSLAGGCSKRRTTVSGTSAKLLIADYGDPGLIRTADTQFRKLLLYPSELRGHTFYNQ